MNTDQTVTPPRLTSMILRRRFSETFQVGEANIEVVSIGNNRVTLRITAPENVKIVRGETIEKELP